MTVAAIRAEFGILPAGDPYGDPNLIQTPSLAQGGTYSVYANKYRPTPNPLAILFTSPASVKAFALAMQGRYIPYSPVVNAGYQSSPLSGLYIGGSTLGTPFSSLGAASAINPVVGTALGVAAGILGSFFSNPCKAPVAQFDQAIQQISGVLTQVLTSLDQLVGLGKIAPGQAAAAWDTYANQALGIIGNPSGCTLFIPFYILAIKAVGDFSKSVFWPDIYPKTIVVNPASPTISTPTPAPANQFAATPAAPPAAVVPSIVAPPNSLAGSPSLGAPIVQGVASGPVNYGNQARFAVPNFQVAGTPPAQPLPQGISTSVVSGGSLLMPLLIVGGIIALAMLY